MRLIYLVHFHISRASSCEISIRGKQFKCTQLEPLRNTNIFKVDNDILAFDFFAPHFNEKAHENGDASEDRNKKFLFLN